MRGPLENGPDGSGHRKNEQNSQDRLVHMWFQVDPPSWSLPGCGSRLQSISVRRFFYVDCRILSAGQFVQTPFGCESVVRHQASVHDPAVQAPELPPVRRGQQFGADPVDIVPAVMFGQQGPSVAGVRNNHGMTRGRVVDRDVGMNMF